MCLQHARTHICFWTTLPPRKQTVQTYYNSDLTASDPEDSSGSADDIRESSFIVPTDRIFNVASEKLEPHWLVPIEQEFQWSDNRHSCCHSELECSAAFYFVLVWDKSLHSLIDRVSRAVVAPALLSTYLDMHPQMQMQQQHLPVDSATLAEHICSAFGLNIKEAEEDFYNTIRTNFPLSTPSPFLKKEPESAYQCDQCYGWYNTSSFRRHFDQGKPNDGRRQTGCKWHKNFSARSFYTFRLFKHSKFAAFRVHMKKGWHPNPIAAKVASAIETIDSPKEIIRTLVPPPWLERLGLWSIVKDLDPYLVARLTIAPSKEVIQKTSKGSLEEALETVCLHIRQACKKFMEQMEKEMNDRNGMYREKVREG